MCVYNGAAHLDAALDSVLCQTYPHFEVIAVDDGSTDRSAAILAARSDPRITVLTQRNQGAAAALAAGLRAARGELVAFLDQDDGWTRDKLATHVDWMVRHPSVDLTFSGFRVVDHDGRDIGLRRRRFHGPLHFRDLLVDFAIGATSNVVVRRSAVEKAGGVDPTFPRMYDLDLFLRVAMLAPSNVEALPDALMMYRRHGAQISWDYAALEREWERVMAKMARLSPGTVSEVGGRARLSARRYFARLAYETGNYRRALQYVSSGFASAPVWFLRDSRNWTTAAASLAGMLLPATLHRALERMFGLRRPESSPARAGD